MKHGGTRTGGLAVGMLDVFSLFPTREPFQVVERFGSRGEDIARALCSDWEQVGRDLYLAIDVVESDLDEVTHGEREGPRQAGDIAR